MRTHLTLLALCLVTASATHAQTRTINFNDVPSGTVVNNTYAGVTFTGQGGPFFAPVQVTDLETPTNALDATLSPVLMTFSSTTYGAGVQNFALDVFGTFDVTGRPYGSSVAPIVFTTLTGQTATFSVDETSSTGRRFSFAPTAIRSILLPADAYFDNISFQASLPAAVPEPAQTAAIGLGLLGLAGRMLTVRKRKASAA